MISVWIFGFFLAILGALEAAVFEQITPISTSAMRFGYSVGPCGTTPLASDGNTNRSTCACAQNMLGRSNETESLWWKATLSEEKPIISVRIFFREDTLDATANNPACVDKEPGCLGWSVIGLCRDKPEYMAANCTKSCGLCSGTVPTTGCTDNDTNCGWMAQNEECVRNPPYMFSECQTSCNVCTTNFKSKYDYDRSAKLNNIDVYIGNSSNGISINDTTNITVAVANMHRLNTYTGPPTTGNNVIVRAPSDYSVTGDVVVIVKGANSGILSICEAEVYIKNATNGTMMCLTNTSTEVNLPLAAAEMGDAYNSGCGNASKTFDTILADTQCADCAQSAVVDSPSETRFYWWKGTLRNASKVRALHVWVRKEKDSCLDQDTACPGWSQIGLCRNESTTMFTKCPFSCGLCTTQYVPNTYCNNTNSTCDWWNNQQECVKNPPLMMKYCRQACDMCPNGTKWGNFVKSRLAVFQNVTAYVGNDPGPINLTSDVIPSTMTKFGVANSTALDDNPVVFRVALDAPVDGDTIILRRPQTSGTLSVCEVRVLGDVMG